MFCYDLIVLEELLEIEDFPIYDLTYCYEGKVKVVVIVQMNNPTKENLNIKLLNCKTVVH